MVTYIDKTQNSGKKRRLIIWLVALLSVLLISVTILGKIAKDFLNEYDVTYSDLGIYRITGLHIEELSWNKKDLTNGSIGSLSIKISLSELLRGVIYIEELKILNGDIVLIGQEDSTSSNTNTTSNSTFKLPPIEISRLELEQINFQFNSVTDSIRIDNKSLELLNFSLYPLRCESINVDSLNMLYISFDTSEDEAPSFKVSDLPNFRLDDIALTRIAFKLEKLGKEQFKIQKTTLELSEVNKETDLKLKLEKLESIIGDTIQLSSKIEEILWSEADGKISLAGLQASSGEHTILSQSISFLQTEDESIVDLEKTDFKFKTLLQLKSLEGILRGDEDKDSSIVLSGRLIYSNDVIQINDMYFSTLRRTEGKVDGSIELEPEVKMVLDVTEFKTERDDVSDILWVDDYQDFFKWPLTSDGVVRVSNEQNVYTIEGTLQTPHGQLYCKTIINSLNETDVFYSVYIYSERLQLDSLLPITFQFPISAKTELDFGGFLSDLPGIDTFGMKLNFDRLDLNQVLYEKTKLRYFFNSQYDSLWFTGSDSNGSISVGAGVYHSTLKEIQWNGSISNLIPGGYITMLPRWKVDTKFSGRYNYGHEFFDYQLILDPVDFISESGIKTDMRGRELQFEQKGGDLAAYYQSPSTQFQLKSNGLPSYKIGMGLMKNLEAFPEMSFKGQMALDSQATKEILGIPLHGRLKNIDISHLANSDWNVQFESRHFHYANVKLDSVFSDFRFKRADFSGRIDIGLITIEETEFKGLSISTDSDSITEKYDISLDQIDNNGPCRLVFNRKIENGQYRMYFERDVPIQIAGIEWPLAGKNEIFFDKKMNPLSGGVNFKRAETYISFDVPQQKRIDILVENLGLDFKDLQDENVKEFKGKLDLNLSFRVDNNLLTYQLNMHQISLNEAFLGEFESIGELKNNAFQSRSTLAHNDGLIDLQFGYDRDQISFQSSIQSVELYALPDFLVPDYIVQKGKVNAEVKGKYDTKFSAEGKLVFEDVGLDLPYLNSNLFLSKDTINFLNDHLSLKNIKVFDHEGNYLNLLGTISFVEPFNYRINVTSEKFNLLETSTQSILYGKTPLKMNLSMTGSREINNINGVIELNSGSHVSYVLQDNFTEFEKNQTVLFKPFALDDTASVRITKKDELNLNIDVEMKVNSTDIDLIINPITQEYIRTLINGKIHFTKFGTDDLLVFGNVSSNSGSAFINLPVISSVNMEIAELNLAWDGQYNKPRIKFIGTQQFQSTTTGLTGYQGRTQLMPVTLYLKFNNQTIESLRPELDVTSENSELSAYIERCSEEERQNMATSLMIFGSLSSNGTSGAGNFLNTYTSKLNELTHRNLQNTDLIFSMQDRTEKNSYGEDVTKTSLNYNLKKGLFDNRLYLNVGGDFDLNAGQSNVNQSSSRIIGNASVHYKLTDKSPWTIQFARDQSYKGVIDGEITEYSLGMGFYRSYPTFKSFFTKPKNFKIEEDKK